MPLLSRLYPWLLAPLAATLVILCLSCRVGKQPADTVPQFGFISSLFPEFALRRRKQVFARINHTTRQFRADRIARIPVLVDYQYFAIVVDGEYLRPVRVVEDKIWIERTPGRERADVCCDPKPAGKHHI